MYFNFANGCIFLPTGIDKRNPGGVKFNPYTSQGVKQDAFWGDQYKVGRVEERAKARRAAGSTALFGRGCAGRESIRLHHVIFWALVAVRGVSVCSSPPVFQPGVVQAVRPPSPRSTLPGFQAGPPAFVFGSVGGRSIVPARSPTRRSRGRGVTLWPVSPSFVRPRPLARALGSMTQKHVKPVLCVIFGV